LNAVPPGDQDIEELRREFAKYKMSRASLSWPRLPTLAPAPDLIIDVGASGGTPGLYKAFPMCRFVLIDAIAENRPALEAFGQKYDISVIISGVGASAGALTLNIAGNRSGSRSSFLKRQGTFEDDPVRPRQVAVARLDALVARGPASIGLKLDVEGFEREVLVGAEALMPSVRWIVAEVSMAPRFDGDPMFAGVYELTRSYGFLFRDIVEIRRNRGGDLRLINALFVRDDSK
jgi:FkbM family methyltransferase